MAKEKKVNIKSQLIKISIILCLAGGISVFFILTKPEPKKVSSEVLPSTVSIVEAKRATGTVWVEAMGTVKAVKDLKIISEVGGRVIWINEKLIPGGIIQKGEVIAKIEETDYEIAVEQAEANLAMAKKELLIQEGAARSAKVMEDMSKISASSQAKELRMKVPHIQAAEANLRASEKLLEQAKKNLVRTEILAPYKILIESEDIEVGNYVTRLSSIAEAYGTDAFWVEVNIPLSKLQFLNIPGINSTQGSKAKVTLQGTKGAKEVVKNGRLLRLAGSLDASGRMAKILIEVDDPLGLESGNRSEVLLLNSYVKVELEGRKLNSMIQLPREYLREGDTVWLMDDSSKLVINSVTIAWRDQDSVYISDGLVEGDRIITTNNFVPIAGMKLRLIEGSANE